MFDHLSQGRWWDRAWTLVEGCTPVSEGCANCWAAAMSYRFKPDEYARRMIMFTPYKKPRMTPAAFKGNIETRPDRLDLPLKVKKPTAWAVWNDLFHEETTISFLGSVWSMMAECPQHIFLILTKRIEKAEGFINQYLCQAWKSLPNVWLGVTAENQEQADRRIPILLQIPAAVRFVSVEPMLGPVDLNRVPYPDPYFKLSGREGVLPGPEKPDDYVWSQKEQGIHWVISGGESGPHARPAHPDWFRSLREQCQAAGVPFFFKQWGEWLGTMPWEEKPIGNFKIHEWNGGYAAYRVGKKTAGRLLDGRTWNEVPHV